jgi:RNA polymerase sigma-70 factor (ECF subfamily)
VFLRHQQDVCRYFQRRLRRSWQEAADLTQEVGVRFLSLKQTLWPDNPRAYLFGIARHVLAEYLESRARQCRLDEAMRIEEEPLLAASAVFRDPAESVAMLQLSRYLLGRLPRRQREVLQAQVGDGYSYEEVAAKLGVTVSTVEKDLSLAKRSLRALAGR